MNFSIDFDNLANMDLHMHTSYSDGADKPSDMLRAAAAKGMKVVGISDHSYTFFDESYCIAMNRVDDYINEVYLLKQRCLNLKEDNRFARALGTDDIALYVGIEQDYYSNHPVDAFDYVIGSVHYIGIPDDGKDMPEGCLRYFRRIYIPVDESPQILKSAADAYYGGDIYRLIEDYFLVEGDVVNRTGADIIGHFDLISKFNENNDLFDPSDRRYVNAWKGAALQLLETGAVFEINTGAISRGYRTAPYPSKEMIDFIKERGGRFILSSDAHCKENIASGFDIAGSLI